MNKAEILDGQSVFDFAVHRTGEVSNAAAIAFVNDISVNDDLEAGTELIIPDSVVDERETKRFFSVSRSKPAGGDVNELLGGGIEFMGIEIDFVVS